MALVRSRAVLLASSVALVTNLALNVVLIPPYGATGAAAATTVAYAVQTVVVLAILRGLTPRPRFFPPLLPAAVAALALAATLAVVRAPVVLELGLGAAVYLLCWVLVVRRIAPDQLQVVRQLAARKVQR